MVTSSFDSGFADDLEDICGVVSILPAEFASETDMGEQFSKEDFDTTEGMKESILVTYTATMQPKVNSAVFDVPTDKMKSHLKPLFIKVEADGKVVHRVLVDGGAAINLMPESMMKKFNKVEADLLPHNMVITDFNGKTSKSKGLLPLDIRVGSVTRPTIFVVVPSKANYSLLLGREWIHGMGAVPSTVHQKMFIWNEKEDLEVIEADESFFQADTNVVNFEKCFSYIGPYHMENRRNLVNSNFMIPASFYLNPEVGFTLKYEGTEADFESALKELELK